MAASTSTEIDEFTEKFEKESSLVVCTSYNSTIVYEENRLWLVGSRASNHMAGMR